MSKFGNTFRASARVPVRLKNWQGRVYWVVDLRGVGGGRKFFAAHDKERAFLYAENVESSFSGSGCEIRNPDLVRVISSIQDKIKKPGDIEKALSFYYSRLSGEKISIQRALNLYFEWMDKQEFSKEYIRHERPRLRRFFQSFKEFQELYDTRFVHACDNVPGAPRTRKNHLAAVSTFLNWCVNRRYLSKKFDGWHLLRVRVPGKRKVLIWSPAEMIQLLKYADSKVLPFLLFGGFTGMRTAEIERLSWDAVGEKYIEVNADISKISRRRLTPIFENLQSWLELIRQKSGRVIRKNPHTLLPKLCEAAGIQWKKNALRDSFISYRLAIVQDAAKVAYEANNSPGTIYTSYRELVTLDQAQEWFSISKDSI
jgi:integrase